MHSRSWVRCLVATRQLSVKLSQLSECSLHHQGPRSVERYKQLRHLASRTIMMTCTYVCWCNRYGSLPLFGVRQRWAGYLHTTIVTLSAQRDKPLTRERMRKLVCRKGRLSVQCVCSGSLEISSIWIGSFLRRIVHRITVHGVITLSDVVTKVAIC